MLTSVFSSLSYVLYVRIYNNQIFIFFFGWPVIGYNNTYIYSSKEQHNKIFSLSSSSYSYNPCLASERWKVMACFRCTYTHTAYSSKPLVPLGLVKGKNLL